MDARGNALLIVNAEVLRCLMHVWPNRVEEHDATVLQRMWTYFRAHLRRTPAGVMGWAHEHSDSGSGQDGPASLWVTAIALTAVARLDKLLTDRINAKVAWALRGRAGRGRPSLDDVIWPDIGRLGYRIVFDRDRQSKGGPSATQLRGGEGFPHTLAGLVCEFRRHLGDRRETGDRCAAVLYGPPRNGENPYS